MMVSVILPSYNHSAYLKKRIDSILSQTYQDFELIILDDKSPDNSKEIIEQYRDNEHISHIIYNEINSGTTFKQWNKGINLAKGKYIWIAESDDYADPRLLETLVNNITNKENTAFSYCQSYKVDSDGEIIGDWLFRTQDIAPDLFLHDFSMNGLEFVEKYMIYKNIVPNASGVLFKKDLFFKVGGADTNIGYIADWIFWMKLLTYGDVTFCHQKLNYFRYHDNSFAFQSVNSLKEKSFNKPDIESRLAYNSFLVNRTRNEQMERIKRINYNHLEESIMAEFRFLWQKGYYHKSLKYICLILKLTSNKKTVIMKGIRFIKSILFK